MESEYSQKAANERELVDKALATVIAGETLDDDTVYALAEISTDEGRRALRQAAANVSKEMCPRRFDPCSIVNARSGKCSENCKWCAQSAHYHTGCDTYDIVNHDECIEAAKASSRHGIKRFSLVASGRSVRGKALLQITDLLRQCAEQANILTCASLGLLDAESLQLLWDSGVRRYHCNLETAPSYFPQLCTTHTIADKLATIEAAHKIGFEVCSGGIIGMGESARQRAELALTLRLAKPCSIPINILCPIPGTPLADMPPISADEILDTVAVFRLAHPRVQLRFAGGRARLSREEQLEALRIGINGAIVGDLLTTVGSTVANDRELVAEAGYEF